MSVDQGPAVEVLADPLANKGTAFAEQERSELGLRGLRADRARPWSSGLGVLDIAGSGQPPASRAAGRRSGKSGGSSQS